VTTGIAAIHVTDAADGVGLLPAALDLDR